ncbi:MAG: translation initiation factor IF-2 [Nanoarchaeota archaeon]|nr:translation initiation factor IF-2 [Nanoarchaeota archaeon]
MLDKVRETTVAKREAGGITQSIGATSIPIDAVKNICGSLLEKLKLKITIPGLLIIDTPGHESFCSLRERGGSCADIAVLVVDINEGFKPQTDESLGFLKQFKTPFLVAATKIDRITGWIKHEGECFYESFEKQPQWVKEKFDEMFYNLVGQLSERGFECERYDRVEDFKKMVSIVPCSGISGEGIPEVLMLLTGLSQQFLKERLEVVEGIGKGSVLEVKEVKGLGTTIDVILYDGEMKKGDWLIIGGTEPIVTKIKSLLKPPAMKELRVEKQFEQVDYVHAAAGIKISAPDLENVMAGSPIAAVTDKSKVEDIKKEMMEAVKQIQFETSGDGVIVKADNLGSLEALVHILKKKDIPIRKASVGEINKKDILEIETVKDPLRKVIIGFNVPITEIAEQDAKDRNIKILKSPIIYRLFEDYEVFVKETYEKIKIQKLLQITRPAKIRLLRGMVFRQNDPAIVGVEVEEGILKSGVKLKRGSGEIGVVKAIQKENVSVSEAVKGDKVAVSIEGPTVGRHINEDDVLTTVMHKNDIKILEELGMIKEAELAKEILK